MLQFLQTNCQQDALTTGRRSGCVSMYPLFVIMNAYPFTPNWKIKWKCSWISYLLVYLFNDSINISYYRVSNDKTMNWKGCERKRFWPDVRYITILTLSWRNWWKPWRTSVKRVSLQAQDVDYGISQIWSWSANH